MAEDNTVKIRKDGSLLSVDNLSPDLCTLLESTLSYTRVVHLRGKEAAVAQASQRFDPVACYRYVADPKAALPSRMIIPAGFLSKVTRALRAANYRPVLRELRPHPRPEVFAPQWERLVNVNWKWMQKETLTELFRRQFAQVKCPPGYGKSFLIYSICKLLPKARIAIATHSVDVLEQIHGELSMRLPSVGMVSGRAKRTGNRVTCYSGKSLHHCEKEVDLLIVDEVHEWGTDHYFEKLALAAFRFARRWAFSANVGDRSDNADFELEGVFGPCIVSLPYQECVQHHCVTPIEIHWRNCVMDYDPSEGERTEAEQERAAIWQNDYRNNLIAADARAFPDDQVLIAVKTIEHAMFLKKKLPEFTLCYSQDGIEDRATLDWYRQQGCIGRNEPLMTLERRRKLKKMFEVGKLRKVIANTVWKRGVDFRKLQVLIRADAESSMISDTQIPGRTSRICDEIGKEVSVVIDYRDQFSEKWRERAYRRSGHYSEIGWPQKFPDRRRRRSIHEARQGRLF
jgi:superfamily II DNA or RNA helicase